MSRSGHDAQRSFKKDMTRLFDEIFTVVREEIDRRAGAVPDAKEI